MANENFDILSMLSSLFQPAEAEAAMAPAADPTQQLFKQLQLANQQKRMQMTDQGNALRERELALREKKLQPAAPVNLQQQLAGILGEGQQQDGDFGVPDLDIRGTEGGVPFFSNWRASREAPQEEQQRVSQLYQERQGKIAGRRAVSQQGRGGIDQDTLARAGQLSTMLHGMKVPSPTIELILRQTFPGIAEAKRGESVKPIAQDKLGNFYNKQTGLPASEEFPTSEPDQERLKKDYIFLDAKTKEKFGALTQLDNTIAQYSRMGGPGGSLDLPAEPGFFSTKGQQVEMFIDRQSGGIKSADLDSINAQITQLAKAFGGDSRVTDKEMALLRGAVIRDGDNQKSVEKKMKNLKGFRDAVSRLIPIPGIQGKYASEQKATPAPSSQPKGAPATQRGIPPGRVPMMDPDGNSVTVPANRVQDKLKSGYKPFGAQ